MNPEEFLAVYERLRLPFEEFLPSTLDVFGPGMLRDAAAHVLLARGKRLRPVLCLAASGAIGARRIPKAALHAAAALEWIHAYSLVHDDLPALDNDDFRRGIPTLHKLYGEAAAVLAGDALHAGAFLQLSMAPVTARRRSLLLQALSRASVDMAVGQVFDTLPAARRRMQRQDWLAMIDGKTGALITAALIMGAVLAGDADVRPWQEYGLLLGRCFQMRDDQLDATGTLEELGKTPGKDAAQEKWSAASVFGARLEQNLRRCLEQTVRKAETLPREPAFFRQMAVFAATRTR